MNNKTLLTALGIIIIIIISNFYSCQKLDDKKDELEKFSTWYTKGSFIYCDLSRIWLEACQQKGRQPMPAGGTQNTIITSATLTDTIYSGYDALHIDFGTGTLCADGKTRKGQLIVYFMNSEAYVEMPGTHNGGVVTQNQNYYVNDIKLWVGAALNKSTTDINGIHILNFQIQDGTIILPKDDGSTQEVFCWIYLGGTQTAGQSTPTLDDDIFETTYTTNNPLGDWTINATYEAWPQYQLPTTMTYNMNCNTYTRGIFTFNSSDNESDFLIDLGSGTCDHTAHATFLSENEEVDIDFNY